jgi:hypothetical protein
VIDRDRLLSERPRMQASTEKDTSASRRSLQEAVARGKEARKVVPRSSQANWEPGPDRVGPLEVLAEQDKARVPELVPVRYGRMLASAFTFYRGAAAIMAADLAASPDSGLRVQLCGDAHEEELHPAPEAVSEPVRPRLDSQPLHESFTAR